MKKPATVGYLVNHRVNGPMAYSVGSGRLCGMGGIHRVATAWSTREAAKAAIEASIAPKWEYIGWRAMDFSIIRLTDDH